MAKKKTEIGKKQHKLDLSQVLYNLDTRNKAFYSNLSDEEKKGYTPLILMRFMSSAPNQGGLHEYHLEAVNEIVNRDFWSLSKHPELQHKLLSICGVGKKQFHSWIPNSKKQTKTKLFDFLKKVLPDANDDEIALYLKINSLDDFKSLLKEYGLQDKEMKEILEQLKSVKNNEE